MVDALTTAYGVGIDTKWRTREDKGCVQAGLALELQREAKACDGHRPEFHAGYQGTRARVVTVALANVDNYWTCAGWMPSMAQR